MAKDGLGTNEHIAFGTLKLTKDEGFAAPKAPRVKAARMAGS